MRPNDDPRDPFRQFALIVRAEKGISEFGAAQAEMLFYVAKWLRLAGLPRETPIEDVLQRAEKLW